MVRSTVYNGVGVKKAYSFMFKKKLCEGAYYGQQWTRRERVKEEGQRVNKKKIDNLIRNWQRYDEAMN